MDQNEQEFIVFQQLRNSSQAELFQTSVQYIELYKNSIGSNYFYKIVFNRNICFSLEFLQVGLKSKYFILERNTIYDLEGKILTHLQQLLLANIHHGKLQLDNIIIELTSDSDKLNPWCRALRIEKVYFVRYQFIGDNNQSDYNSILSIISELDSISFGQGNVNLEKEQSEITVISKQEQLQIIQNKLQYLQNKRKPKSLLQFQNPLNTVIADPRYRWGNSCVRIIQDLITRVNSMDTSQYFEQTPENQMHQSQIVLQFQKDLESIYKDILLDQGLLQRMEEIGNWFNSDYSSMKWNWNLKLSEQIINEGIAQFYPFLLDTEFFNLNENYSKIIGEIKEQYNIHFKLDINLEQEKLIEHYLQQILFRIQDKQPITKDFSQQLLKSIIERAYEEEVQLAILQLIQELI